MFTAEDRDSVQARLLARAEAEAEADGAIAGAAFTGSLATGDGDRWSDTDLVLAVRGELAPVVSQWTRWLYRELGALDPPLRLVLGGRCRRQHPRPPGIPHRRASPVGEACGRDTGATLRLDPGSAQTACNLPPLGTSVSTSGCKPQAEGGPSCCGRSRRVC